MLTIQKILNFLPGSKLIGNSKQEIKQLVQLTDNISSNDLCWCSEKHTSLLKNISKGTVICSGTIDKSYVNNGCNYILVDNPRLAFKNILEKFFVNNILDYKIESSSFIHPNSKIEQPVKIGHNVVIEEDVEIGSGTIIGHNTVILKGTLIGKKVKIGSNNTIGGVGFGYEREQDGSYSLIHHIGNVIIEDNVEIGNNTCIDRAVLGSTLIHKNVKIDNLVHIAHGVELGENSLVIANAMVAGSVKVGKNSWIAPSASILNKKTIGDNAVIGMGAVVVKDVISDDVVAGNPAKTLKK